VAHGDVEHFRPKSVYWWLAYCYDNHLYACQICNQVFKKDRFPVRRKMRPPRVAPGAGEAELRAVAAAMTPDPVNELEGMSWAAYAARCRAENPGLPDPYLTDPEPLMAWEADEIQKRVLVKPRGGSARALKDFQAMEECFGLNREELAGWRYQTYRALRVLCMYLERLPKDDALRRQTVQEILRMRSDRSAYAGMVRYFLAEWGVSLG
ncbi:MAG: hypothetical protein HYR60_00930, partial [Acidobacteria bacterium]|nr:hypothetical protein [Acidobacteriota bacterium]